MTPSSADGTSRFADSVLALSARGGADAASPHAAPDDPAQWATSLASLEVCRPGLALLCVASALGLVVAASGVGVHGWLEWLTRAGVASAAAMAALAAWLVVVCAARYRLARLPLAVQRTCLAGAGALAALYGHGLVVLAFDARWQDPSAWLAAGLAGGVMALSLHTALRWRARAVMPASTVARVAELQARIRPHFLFNALNTAVALVRHDPARAERVLEDLSELFRAALEAPDKAMAAPVSLASELALARRYLAIEELRFGDRLKIEWALDETVGRARLPPLVLQPLVENAIRHGIEALPAGGTLRIQTSRSLGRAVVDISNPLPFRTQAASAGHGIALANVRERLQLLHDVQAEFSAGESEEQGRLVWRVRLAVPLD
jgi:two-component system sensor histidine kinase AlgZ